MLSDLTYWLSSLHPEQLLALVSALLIVDTPRYALSKLAMVFYDSVVDFVGLLRGRSGRNGYGYCPTVCAILVAHNEEDTLDPTLRSVLGTYPRLEVIIVDDGSTDATRHIAQRLVDEFPGVRLLRKENRGGKASAYNLALRFASAEVLVVMDCDTEADPNAVWEAVQPLANPHVGAVSAAVLVREPMRNLVTCLQAFEYLHSIFVGRLLMSRLGVLGIVSGAFGAFRRDVVVRVGGWDIGPGDDSDMTMRVRKAGYQVAYAPYAQCLTNVPQTWAALWKQRRRWNRGAIRYKCRKHVDMAAVWNPGFLAGNFFLLVNVWVFNIAFLYTFWFFFVWTLLHWHAELWHFVVASYLIYILFHIVQAAAILFYSTDRGRDALVCCVLPLAPAYQFFRKCVRLISVTEEIFFRASFDDPFYPDHVRAATFRW
ncbi:MAG: glycosyltransferase [Phycisphaera sp.]|nr:glycosyltransferase [Phycisphaera sp.]